MKKEELEEKKQELQKLQELKAELIQKRQSFLENDIIQEFLALEDLINEGKLKNTGDLLEESTLISSPFPKGVPSYYSEMTTAIFNAVNEMVLGAKTPEEAFNAMDTKIKELAAR